MRRDLHVATICSLLLSAPALAGMAQGSMSPMPLDIVSVVREAVALHPRVAEAASDLEARRVTISAARAGYLPRISAGVESSYDSRIRNSWSPRPTAAIDQMVFDFGKVASAVAAARADTRIGEARLLLAIDDLARQTAYAATELQRAAALERVATQQLKRVEEISRLVSDRTEAGATTRSDAIQARARVEGARATLSQIAASRGRWAAALGFLTGREAPVDTLAEGVPAFLGTACADAVLRPEPAPSVLIAEAQKQEAAANLRRSRADQYPTISFGGDASTDVASPTSDRSIYSFGLRASSEIFGGGARRARVRAAELALGAAEQAIAAARLDARQALIEAETQIPQLRALMETLDRRYADMAETGRLYELQYLQMGTRSLVDLLNAEQELVQVAFDIVNTRHDLRRIELDCLYNSGRFRTAFGIDAAAVAGRSR